MGASEAEGALDAVALAKTLAPSAAEPTVLHVAVEDPRLDGNGTDLGPDAGYAGRASALSTMGVIALIARREWPLLEASLVPTVLSRRLKLDPAAMCLPTTSDQACASQKTSIEANSVAVIVRAPSPSS